MSGRLLDKADDEGRDKECTTSHIIIMFSILGSVSLNRLIVMQCNTNINVASLQVIFSETLVALVYDVKCHYK